MPTLDGPRTTIHLFMDTPTVTLHLLILDKTTKPFPDGLSLSLSLSRSLTFSLWSGLHTL